MTTNYSCKRCGYETYNTFILKRHFLRKNICKEIFNDMSQEELLKDFEENNKKYTCEKCNQSFENSNKKYKHKQKCNSLQISTKLLSPTTHVSLKPMV